MTTLHCVRCAMDWSHDCIPVGHQQSRLVLIEPDGTERAGFLLSEAEGRTLRAVCACGASWEGLP